MTPAGRRLLAAALLSALAAHGRAERADSKNTPAIKQYYQDALQSYARGDYREAIIKWTAILKEDADQKTAQTMILTARQQIAVQTTKRRRRAHELIALGQYRKAVQEIQSLLDQDPGDPQLETLQRRLERVIKIAPGLVPMSKAARAAIRGIAGLLALPPDTRLAHDGLRYACELAPDEELYKNLLAMLLEDYPELAAADPVTPGMKFLEFKHFVAVHQIYDAKYHLAVITLNEILALEPKDLLALKRLGSAYYSLGRKSDARAAWSAALELAPQDKTLRRFLAKTGSVDPEAAGARTYKSSEATP